MYDVELSTALDIARGAGEIIMGHYSAGFETEEKIGADSFSEPVTIADREASRYIVDRLAEAFPKDAVLSEEEDDDIHKRLGSQRVWIVDPIDGTAGFVKRQGDFSVQIGLAVLGRPVAGVVHMPYHGETIYAARESGAHIVRGKARPAVLAVSTTSRMDALRLAMSRNHASPKMERVIRHFGFRSTVRRGSVGLKVGLIADDRCDVYMHLGPRTKLWDTCAPQIILEEAGGRLTDIFGRDLAYDRSDLQNRDGLLATNGAAHDAVVGQLLPLLAELGRGPFNSAA